jgi:hypothetical protein
LSNWKFCVHLVFSFFLSLRKLLDQMWCAPRNHAEYLVSFYDSWSSFFSSWMQL